MLSLKGLVIPHMQTVDVNCIMSFRSFQLDNIIASDFDFSFVYRLL